MNIIDDYFIKKVKIWDFVTPVADLWEETITEPMKMAARIWITVRIVSKMGNLQNQT